MKKRIKKKGFEVEVIGKKLCVNHPLTGERLEQPSMEITLRGDYSFDLNVLAVLGGKLKVSKYG